MKTPCFIVIAWAALSGATVNAAQAAPPVPDKLDLPTAVAFALENNFAIRQARERIRQQTGIVTTVAAAGLPNASGGASYQHSDIATAQTVPGQPPVFLSAGPSWRINLGVTQTLYAGGRIRAANDAAELEREAAILDLKSVVNDTLLNVRTGFYNVLLAREQIKVQEQNLELLKSQLHTATARAQAGTASDFERLRAEVAVANAQAPLIRARNDLRLAIEDLRRGLGFTTNDPESVRKVPEFIGGLSIEPVTIDLEAAFQAARQNRPDLQRLGKIVAAREAGVDIAKAGYLPTVSARGGYDLRKGATNSFSDSRDGFLVAGQARAEVSRATAGQIVQADAQLEIARLAEAEARLGAEVEVRRAHSLLQQATELAGAAQKTVEQADEAVRLANARYNVGAATQLDVLKVQVELTTARTNHVRASYDYNLSVAQLRRAMGIAEVDYTPLANMQR